jgi:hypothetical protein
MASSGLGRRGKAVVKWQTRKSDIANMDEF